MTRRIDPKYHIPDNVNILIYIQNGLEKLKGLFGIDKIDDERIVDYLAYQLHRQVFGFEKGTWHYTWLFSQNALNKYKQQFMSANGKSGINFYINKWLKERNLTRAELVDIIADKKPNSLKRMLYLPSEESIKQRFLNTTDGINLCICATTGWSPFSATCKKCDNRAECEQITAMKYPELVRYRREEYGKQEKR